MKWNSKLTYITLGYLLINGLFYWHATTLNGGESIIYIVIFPAFWIIALLTTGIFAYRRRKIWFSKEVRISTLVLLFFCTPFSFSAFAWILRPSITLSSSGYNPKNGITIKDENWIYPNSKTAINKYWRLNTEDYSSQLDENFKKDSVWVYLNKEGDTIKTETYKNDTLIKTKNFEHFEN